MTMPPHDLFAFWESDLANTGVEPELQNLDALSLALELQNSDWSEQEAGLELSRRCSGAEIRAALTQLLATLQWCPVLLPRAICATRALWRALDIAATT